MKNIILLISLFLFMGCNRNEDAPDKTVLEAVVYVYLNNSEGSDIIDTPNYNNQTIKVSYIDPSSAFYQNGYLISKDANGKKFVMIYLNYGSENDTTASTIIKWNNTDQDILKAEFSKTKNSIIVEKVYLNDKLVCPDRDHLKIIIAK